MLRKLQNRLTKYSVLAFMLAIICLILLISGWPGEKWTPYTTTLAILLLTSSVLIQGYGFFEARHFSREGALQVYQSMARVITELRTLAETLHNEYGRTIEGRRRYDRDKRYRRLLREFANIKMRCKDYRLEQKLRKIIEREKAAAKYLPLADRKKFPSSLENADVDIREYILKRFPRRSEEIENG